MNQEMRLVSQIRLPLQNRITWRSSYDPTPFYQHYQHLACCQLNLFLFSVESQISLYDKLPLQHSIRHSDAIESAYEPRVVANNVVKFETRDATARAGSAATRLGTKFGTMDTINRPHTRSGALWCARGCPGARRNMDCVYASNAKP